MPTTNPVLNIGALVEQSNDRIAQIKHEQGVKITDRARNLGFLAFCLVGVGLVGLMAFQIIAGTFALLVGFGGLAFMFYAIRYLKMNDKHIKQKMQNRVIANMIEEAKTHKIETLTNLVIDSRNRLDAAREARNKMGGYVEKIKARLNESDQDSSSYATKVQMAERVESAYEMVCGNVDRAGAAHKALTKKVEEYKEMAEFSDIVGDAMAFAKSNTGTLDEMLGMEAFAAIEQDFQEAMVSIENSVSDFEIDND
ncbi:hypothetical protein [Marinobacterium lutimaris]|uniref:5-bromo-4-chloroindolyl phosphate hydrolysis protein n=1 Tax=Marinobacterium lutimaris TaxID=568106 RepID=A0A1H5XRV8_9GAMM|nr:hypothetical protein [Marinobacterium lutimaris]SEG14167.1 hypothetical protein SAMN05444390_1011474 [Marinobacterium lutimaris]